MGAGVHKCSSTKTRHMPQAGGSSTNNCQFLGSFKCLLRLHLSFFIGKTQVLEQKTSKSFTFYAFTPKVRTSFGSIGCGLVLLSGEADASCLAKSWNHPLPARRS